MEMQDRLRFAFSKHVRMVSCEHFRFSVFLFSCRYTTLGNGCPMCQAPYNTHGAAAALI